MTCVNGPHEAGKVCVMCPYEPTTPFPESVVPQYELRQHTIRDLLVTRLGDGTYVVGQHKGNGTYQTVASYPKDSRALAVALANDVDWKNRER